MGSVSARRNTDNDRVIQKAQLRSKTVSSDKQLIQSNHNISTNLDCSTCRRRNIKCDQAKPLCKACRMKGYTCCGYSNLEPARMFVAPHTSNRNSSEEHRAFQFFMETTMTWFDSESGQCILETVDGFWNPVVLQVTESEPAIKHILLAWSELHRRILHGPMSPDEPFENAFFWQNHSQALRLLGSKKQIDTSVILIACIMFCILENFRGRRDVFLRHFESGLRILHHYDHTSATNRSSSICDDMINRYLRPILMAFDHNLNRILRHDLIQPPEKTSTRMLQLRSAGRPIKAWD